MQRHPEKGDRRAKLVVPTKRGREVMRLSDGIIADIERKQANVLGQTAYEEFNQTLATVGDALRRESDEPGGR